ncbi:MAG: cysteine desulfurase family protein, partial [Mariprofundales bacterium]|nr:cysteine desulfurase family protein [Mariprofundales bacterium]
MKRYYFDHNANCPMLPEAIERYAAVAASCAGNPSSMHWAGRSARRALDDARDEVANYVGVEAGAIIFTSGGTESNNIALQGWLGNQPPGEIVSTMIEHPSVLRPLERWQQSGDPTWRTHLIKPDRNGVVAADKMIAAINSESRLVSMMSANNESGVIQPVVEVAQACREQGVAIHIDAVQSLGKTDIKTLAQHADFLSLSSHKIGGPVGVGALIVRRGRELRELAPGGGQERKRRSGTESVAAICAFATALGRIDFAAITPLRNYFEQQLQQRVDGSLIIGNQADRIGNTSLFSIPGLEGETLLMQLDLA